MNFKPILLLSSLVTCLYCHSDVCAELSPRLFPSIGTNAEAPIAKYVNAYGEYCESTVDLEVPVHDNESDRLILKRIYNTAKTDTGEQVGGWKILPELFILDEKKQSKDCFERVLEDGTKRIYEKAELLPTLILGLEQLTMQTSQVNDQNYFRLTKEILPSTKQINYNYDQEGNPSSIELKNTFENQLLAWMHFSTQEDNNNYHITVLTSDDQHLKYTFTLQDFSDGTSAYVLTQMERTNESPCNFVYEIKDHACSLVKKEFQDGRSVDISYDDEGKVKTITTTGVNGNQKVLAYSNHDANESKSASVSCCTFCGKNNIARNGTAYGWSGMTSAIANTGRVARPGLNNSNLNNNVDLEPNGDKAGAWEAAGIIWPNPVNITAVDFINGSVTRDGDGFLTANCMLQFSTDGSTWTNSGWTISPSYPYSAKASGKTYKFSGPAVSGILGARVVGQVRTTDTSYHWIVKEIRVTGSTGPVTSFVITASAGANGSISPSGTVSVTQGSSQSFTITPAAGYTIDSVLVDGTNKGAISTYTFSNIQANHSISATFVTASCSVPPATPTGLTSPSQTSSSVNLSWNPESSPAGCSVTYKVYNGGTLVATVPTTTVVINGLSPDTTYVFTVVATNSAGISPQSAALSVKTLSSGSSGNYTAQQILSAIQSHMTSSVQVNTLPHINTMTRQMNVNVYQVSPGVFAYTSSMAIDTDGSDPDRDPDHQDETTWQDSNGAHLGSHHVPFYVLGDDCWDRTSPCRHFFYREHNVTGLQFALMFYNGKVIGAVFGDTQTANNQTTSDNDSRELGEASVAAANMLGIPSSGTTGGVDNGVTVVIFSGPDWVVKGTNQGTGPVGSATGSLSGNAQALVQKALNTLGVSFGL